jgi:hypothetical protein
MDRSRVAGDARAGLRRPLDALRLLLPGSLLGRIALAPFLIAASIFVVFVIGSLALAAVDSATGFSPTTLDASGIGADDAWVMGYGILALALVHSGLAIGAALVRERRIGASSGR